MTLTSILSSRSEDTGPLRSETQVRILPGLPLSVDVDKRVRQTHIGGWEDEKSMKQLRTETWWQVTWSDGTVTDETCQSASDGMIDVWANGPTPADDAVPVHVHGLTRWD